MTRSSNNPPLQPTEKDVLKTLTASLVSDGTNSYVGTQEEVGSLPVNRPLDETVVTVRQVPGFNYGYDTVKASPTYDGILTGKVELTPTNQGSFAFQLISAYSQPPQNPLRLIFPRGVMPMLQLSSLRIFTYFRPRELMVGHFRMPVRARLPKRCINEAPRSGVNTFTQIIIYLDAHADTS